MNSESTESQTKGGKQRRWRVGRVKNDAKVSGDAQALVSTSNWNVYPSPDNPTSFTATVTSLGDWAISNVSVNFYQYGTSTTLVQCTIEPDPAATIVTMSSSTSLFEPDGSAVTVRSIISGMVDQPGGTPFSYANNFYLYQDDSAADMKD